MRVSKRRSSDLLRVASLAERFPVGGDAGLPFLACFFADMGKYLLHLTQPVPDLTPPLAGRGVVRLGDDPAEVPLALGDKCIQALQCAFAAHPHFSSPS